MICDACAKAPEEEGRGNDDDPSQSNPSQNSCQACNEKKEQHKHQPSPSPSSGTTSIAPQCNQFNSNSDLDTKLLQILCTEIYIDGGGSLVTSLKGYLKSPKQFDALLKRRNQQQQQYDGKPKLLTFLEEYSPNVFQVDRNASPHWVTLATNEYVDMTDDDIDPEIIFKKKTAVLERLNYVLRKRQSKLERRNQKYNQTIYTTKSKFDDNFYGNNTVNMFWLIKQCQWEFHDYLRASRYYCNELYDSDNPTKEQVVVQPVGTKEWEDLVVDKFVSILKQHIETMDSKNNSDELMCDIRDREVWIKAPVIDPPPDDSTTDSNKELDEIVTILTRLVQDDGGHQVSLELLIHRHQELKRLLGGRDFWKLYEDEQKRSSFSSLSVTRIDGIIILKTNNKKNKNRMSIEDDEGLFSVTNSRWASAIGNIMINCCRQFCLSSSSQEKIVKNIDGGDANSHNSNKGDRAKRKKIKMTNVSAIDMTASIGGMTLGLAKTRQFDKIIAIELDEGRSKACQENMKKHGMANIVEVWNDDSVAALSKIVSTKALPVFKPDTIPTPATSGEVPLDMVDDDDDDAAAVSIYAAPLCIVIDPPWGGYQYKQKMRNQQKTSEHDPASSVSPFSQFRMGPWLLEEVLRQISINFSFLSCGVLVGLRLPTTFDMDKLMETMTKEYRLDLSIIDIRKLSVQLFVVLNIKGTKNENFH